MSPPQGGLTQPCFSLPTRSLTHRAHNRYAKPGLSYADTIEMYHQYRVIINVNSITASTTMCARRSFEVRLGRNL
jgi:hypothetical protein